MPTFSDRARSFIAANASRVPIIGGAFRARPSAAASPFGPDVDPSRANLPPPALSADQPQAPETPTRFRPGYHDRTLRAYNPIRNLGGWDVKRKDRAVELHDEGIFLESATLARAVTRYAPVATALMLRRAPVLFLDRKIRRAARGFARIVGEEIETQLADRGHGELPSPTFPPVLWGAMQDNLAMMGFCWLQNVLGPPGPDGVRMIWTRRWPAEAIQYYRYRRTFVALTLDGPVDMVDGDGKWILVAKSDEPLYDGAIRAVGSEYLSGGFARASLDNYVDEYGEPKWHGIAPEGIGPNTDNGIQFSEALQTMREPGAWAEFPYGSKLEVTQLDAKTSQVFNDADRLSLRNILIAILGSEGGIEKNTGVYTPASILGVRYDIAADDLAAITRAMNFGRIRVYRDINYAATVEKEEAAGRWVDPVIEIELPDEELDARTEAIGKRMLSRAAVLKANAESNIATDQDAADAVSRALELEPVPIVGKRQGGQIYDYHITQKQVAPDEVRKDLGLPEMPGGVGSLARLAEEREKGLDKTGQTKITEQTGPGGEPLPGEGSAEPASGTDQMERGKAPVGEPPPPRRDPSVDFPAALPPAADLDGRGSRARPPEVADVVWTSIGRRQRPPMRITRKEGKA